MGVAGLAGWERRADFFKRVIDSQKEFAERVVFYDIYNSADYKLAYEHYFGPLGV